MDIKDLLAPSTCDNTPLTHGTMDVQDFHGQHTSTSSQPSVASGRDSSMAMRSVGAFSNQCNTQFITTKDSKGHYVSILADVGIGSKAARERRKRNAAASERYRLNTKIDDLQKELSETRERLIRVTAERDRLKSIVEQD
jgi:hypothetical protein